MAEPAADLVSEHAFVVPAYGQSPYLPECLRSLRAQTSPSPAVITTSTPSDYLTRVARDFGIDVIVNKRREGIGADWNFALGATTARFVTLAHQDDVYYPEFKAKTLERLAANDGAVLCFTGFDVLDDLGGCRSTKVKVVMDLLQTVFLGSSPAVRGLRLRAFFSVACPIACPSVTYDRSRLAGFRFSKDYVTNVDWDAWLRLTKQGETFARTPERLIGRRYNELTETSRQIRSGRRHAEDLMTYRRLWPSPIAETLALLYRAGT